MATPSSAAPAPSAQQLAPPVTIPAQDPARERGLLATVDVTAAVGAEYVPMVHDLVRMLSIQVAVQLMLVLGAAGSRSFFTADFALTLVYIVLGVALYWLVVRKVVAFH